MKDWSSDKKAVSVDEDENRTMNGQNSNLDIQYLLSYINTKPNQQLNLTNQNNLFSKKQILQNKQIIDYLLILGDRDYLLIHGDRDNSDNKNEQNNNREQNKQKKIIVKIIDQGIRLISRIKQISQKTKLSSNNKSNNITSNNNITSSNNTTNNNNITNNKSNNTSNNKSNGKVNATNNNKQLSINQIFHQILFNSFTNKTNKIYNGYQNGNNKGNNQQSEQQMKKYCSQQQINLLIAKNQYFINNQTDKSQTNKYKYLITYSLYQSIQDNSNQPQLINLINQLQTKINSLQNQYSHTSVNCQMQSKQISITIHQIWTHIDFINAKLYTS